MTRTSDFRPTPGRLRIAVVVGSIRPNRAGGPIARWLVERLRTRPDLQLDLVDLAEIDLPLVLDFDEVPDEVTALGARLDAADAFVVVTPEYNHSFPASLKQAIDWFHDEWSVKPVGFVSYGGNARGLRAVEHLRQVFVELHATTIRDGVAIALDGEVDEQGRPDAEGVEGAVKLMTDQLLWWARALREARAARGYVA